jgi:hypothetical protein
MLAVDLLVDMHDFKCISRSAAQRSAQQASIAAHL